MKPVRLLIAAWFSLPISAGAQVDADPCRQVRAEDVATLITLNQAEVTADHEAGSTRCSFTVQRSIDSTSSRLDLTITKFGSHAAAVAAMKRDVPFSFDKQTALVKTADSGDHLVTGTAARTSASAEAVHDDFMAHVDINGIEAGARDHPTFEYRLQRLALQGVGADILPSEGLAPDPASPQRQPASFDPQSSDPAEASRWLDAGVLGIGALAVLGPAFGLFIFYRAFLGPRLKRKRLLRTGVPGTAFIEGVSDTGVTVNNSAQVRYACVVAPASGAPPYRASTKMLVSRLVAPASQIGSTVQVMIDPADPQSFTFV